MESGSFDSLLEIPEWVRECPESKARGISLAMTLKPDVVWSGAQGQDGVVPYTVKIVKETSEEADIYDQLRQNDRASPNHTLPCDVIRSSSHPAILVMPCAAPFRTQFFPDWTMGQVLDSLLQIVEGLEFLHDHHLVHLDLRPDNLLFAEAWDVKCHKELEIDKIYIIDFSESHQLSLGPGQQRPIDLPQSILPKPLNMQRFDPYSFDVYCLGSVLNHTLSRVYRKQPRPWMLQRYTQWLIGTERGCTGVCRCRPTARRARQIFVVLRWIIRGTTTLENVLRSIRDVFSPRKPPA
ncbi:hypothetical protein L226DRAFT_250026 [Lentinus tigrinus ALCF2SS1-7]|uniref:Protein kinase domain-containing protein n=1 Tax=Lentinus tigrinus ALCF2SS1-6 TaxID=1328759 RepID=A0A5C2SV73_9APHY|nr:hypothetical protein L227DRAFT_203944 [Lentinus tigrinus ALCF2SS1-6]RPD79428.1 hypothetical protein L226DRAFT_250026 [Lentinus tigrinus ALCF2SS1-7]